MMRAAALARLTMAGGAVTVALAACAQQAALPGATIPRTPRTTASPRPATVDSRYDPCALSFPKVPVGRALANLYAGSLMCEFAVPPGARRLSRVPDAGHGFLGQSLPQTGLAYEVSRTQFWQVPGNPQGALAWEKLHLPRALASTGSGSGSLGETTVEWQDDYGLPAVPGEPSASGQINSRTMTLSAVDAGDGRTDIEVAVSVDWIPPRPTSELVPSAVRAVKIAAVPDMNLHIAPPAPVTVTNPVQVRKIVALIDGLPLSPSGVFHCPMDGGAEIVLTFLPQATGGRPLAVVQQRLEGCGWTSITIGGRQQPNLGAPSGGHSIAAQVLRIAGLPWNLSALTTAS